jgi:hypothetical protein
MVKPLPPVPGRFGAAAESGSPDYAGIIWGALRITGPFCSKARRNW